MANNRAPAQIDDLPPPPGVSGGIDDLPPPPAPKGEGLLAKIARNLSVGTQARDAVAFAHPYASAKNPADIVWDDPFAAGGMPPSAEPAPSLVKPGDLEDVLTANAPLAEGYLRRKGLSQEDALAAGLPFDVVSPGDPTGPILGKGIAKTSDQFRKLGLWRALNAAERGGKNTGQAFALLKRLQVAGGLKNQARMMKEGLADTNNAFGATMAEATDAGAAVDAEKFLQEAGSHIQKSEDFGTAGAANSIRQDMTRPVEAKAREGKLSFKDAKEFIDRWWDTNGSDPDKRAIRGILRGQLTGDMPAELGARAEQQLLDQSTLMNMIPPVKRASLPSKLVPWALPGGGAAVGAGYQLLHGRSPLKGALVGAALTNPWTLTRGAQLFDAASPALGSLGTQEFYRLPQEENQ